MNQKSMYKMKNLKNFISFNSLCGNKSNMFCINNNESEIHRYIKYRICTELVKKGYEFFTEVILKSGKRCDIIAFSKEGEGTIIEVINSESEESINQKAIDYPMEFNFYTINCSEKLEEQLYFL